jgi:hypothetical protein
MLGTCSAEPTAGKTEARQRPIVDDLRDKHDSIRCAAYLAAHVQLSLIARFATE